MSKYICPSCGAPFNGKKCKNCAYESFSEEVAHNLHVHEGEPLVIHDTARKTVPYRDPFDCPPKPKKQASITTMQSATATACLPSAAGRAFSRPASFCWKGVSRTSSSAGAAAR